MALAGGGQVEPHFPLLLLAWQGLPLTPQAGTSGREQRECPTLLRGARGRQLPQQSPVGKEGRASAGGVLASNPQGPQQTTNQSYPSGQPSAPQESGVG